MVFLLALTALAWLFYGADKPPPPTPCTCRQLADHPTTYAGKVVRVSTRGTQAEGKALAWRRESHLPPAVVLRGSISSPPPPSLTGTCHAPLAGGPVTVTGCRP